MKLHFKNGLLYTTIKVTYKGKTKVINNIIVDTGAAHTIISPDVVDDIGIKPEMHDDFITMYGLGGEKYAYRKAINAVEIGDCLIENCDIDFGLIDDEGYVSGLLGLDLLMKAEAIIDLKQFNIRINSSSGL